jgi:hypothetical protein
MNIERGFLLRGRQDLQESLSLLSAVRSASEGSCRFLTSTGERLYLRIWNSRIGEPAVYVCHIGSPEYLQDCAQGHDWKSSSRSAFTLRPLLHAASFSAFQI